MSPRSRGSIFTEFLPDDAVRLFERRGLHAADAACRVVGRFDQTAPTYLVSFGDDESYLEVGPAEIYLVNIPTEHEQIARTERGVRQTRVVQPPLPAH